MVIIQAPAKPVHIFHRNEIPGSPRRGFRAPFQLIDKELMAAIGPFANRAFALRRKADNFARPRRIQEGRLGRHDIGRDPMKLSGSARDLIEFLDGQFQRSIFPGRRAAK
jgi:hypothetical protein